MIRSLVSVIVLAGLACGCENTAPPRATPPAIKAGQQPEALMRLGDDLTRQGDLASAVNFYRTAADLIPKSPVPLVKMGEAYTNASDPQRAEQAYRAALAFAPSDPDATRGLGISLLAQNKPNEALELLRRLDRGQADARLLRAEGTALDLLGHGQDAQAVYRRGLAADPTDAALHGNLALSMALNGDRSGALFELRAAIGSPKPDQRQEANAVLVLALLGRMQDARARGAESIGVEATDVLLARVEKTRAANPGDKVWALGVLTSTLRTSGPAPPTDLPPPNAPVRAEASPPAMSAAAAGVRPEAGSAPPPGPGQR